MKYLGVLLLTLCSLSLSGQDTAASRCSRQVGKSLDVLAKDMDDLIAIRSDAIDLCLELPEMTPKQAELCGDVVKKAKAIIVRTKEQFK